MLLLACLLLQDPWKFGALVIVHGEQVSNAATALKLGQLPSETALSSPRTFLPLMEYLLLFYCSRPIC